MGCGRVGARLASMLDAEGHEVTIMDIDTYSFRRLPSSFNGTALFGNGIDQEAMKRAGLIIKDSYDDTSQITKPNIGDTSDLNWSSPVKKSWPYFMMGVSQMWLS